MRLLCSKRKLIIWALTILFCLVILSGCYFFPEEEEVLAPPLKKPEKITYNTINIKKGNIESSATCRGYVVPVEQVNLSFEQRGGYLKKIYKNIGAKIVKGDLLAELDTGNLENDVKKQEIVLGGTKTTYNQLLKTGDADVRLAEIELENLKNEYQKMKAIESVYAVSDINDMEQKIKKQEVLLVKAEDEYQRNVNNAKKELDIAQIQFNNLLLELENSKLFAPISGEIDYVTNINEGEYVNAHDTFMVISDDSKLQLEYTGNKSSEFVNGMEVEVDMDKEKFKGEVIMTVKDVPHEEYEKYKDTVRFKVDNLLEGVRIGQSAQIKAILDKRDNVIVVPKSVVHNFMNRQFVKVLENGLVSDRDVKVGIESSTEYEIVEGLKVGEKVLK